MKTNLNTYQQSKPYRRVVADILAGTDLKTVLDTGAGGGYLRSALAPSIEMDGVDKQANLLPGYLNCWPVDLDEGLPDWLPCYDAIICCEVISYLSNPLNFLKSALRHLVPEGMIVISTPSVWYPESRLFYLLKGYFPSVRSVTVSELGSPHYVVPYSFPQLYSLLIRSGFKCVRFHGVDRGPKRIYEWPLGLPHWLYCKFKENRATECEEKSFWHQAGSVSAIYGRRMVVTAVAPKEAVSKGFQC